MIGATRLALLSEFAILAFVTIGYVYAFASSGESEGGLIWLLLLCILPAWPIAARRVGSSGLNLTSFQKGALMVVLVANAAIIAAALASLPSREDVVVLLALLASPLPLASIFGCALALRHATQ